ncbi:hypothetical protein V5799_029542 [Amblyomma americanum]|uniref:Uncharacterized protein n=1 Tax=Amblyomma americanum TaxID=6943 RepID=A0AAQ4EQR5_AMBAM
MEDRRSDDDSGEASCRRGAASRTRSRSFNNSSSGGPATSSSPSRKEDGGSRARAACSGGATTAKKAYSLESIQRCKRWRPCQLLREVFAKTPLLFGARRQQQQQQQLNSSDKSPTLMTPASESVTLSSEDSGHAESPASLVSVVVIESPPSPMPGELDEPCFVPLSSKSRRSCSADSAVDFDSSEDAALMVATTVSGAGANGSLVVSAPDHNGGDHVCSVLVHGSGGGGGDDGFDVANSLHQPQHHLHRTSLPGDRVMCANNGGSKRPLAQCLSLSCPVLSAPCVIVSDFSSCDVSPEIIEEVDAADHSSGGEARDYLSLGGRSCSSCSLSSTVSSASWDDEASQSDVSEAGSAGSSKRRAIRAGVLAYIHLTASRYTGIIPFSRLKKGPVLCVHLGLTRCGHVAHLLWSIGWLAVITTFREKLATTSPHAQAVAAKEYTYRVE